MEKSMKKEKNFLKKVFEESLPYIVGFSLFLLPIFFISPSTYNITSPEEISITKPFTMELNKKRKNYNQMSWYEAYRFIQTPEQAQDYLNVHFKYFFKEGRRTPGEINESSRGKTSRNLHYNPQGCCFDYATVAATMLFDNNYPPLILSLKNSSISGIQHAVFLYKTKDGFGLVGNTPIKAKHSSIDKLILNLNKKYDFNYDMYQIINLNQEKRNWIAGDIDLFLKMPSFKSRDFNRIKF